jgi:hypothetical protein
VSDPSPIDVHPHPPERRRRQTVTLPCGCCCCCCCCLHTLGGLIGAAIGSNVASRTPPPPYPGYLYEGEEGELIPPRRRYALSPAALYWIILAVLVNITFLLCFLGFGTEPFDPSRLEGLGAAILILAIFLPAVQLVASVIAMLVAGLTDRPNAAARIWAVGKITLGTLIGTAIGIGIMFVICFPMWR